MQKVKTSNRAESERIMWYRTPLDKETMRRLNAKSDWKGFAQAGGHLGILILTGATTLWAAAHSVWWLMALAVFLHGTVAAFAINAVHELIHKSVFKTQWLNQLFVRIFAVLGWISFEHFYNSHMRHHQFTLHPPDDLEVVLPMRVLTKQFFMSGFISLRPWLPIAYYFKTTWRLAHGQFAGEWENRLYPEDEPEKALPIKAWARTLIATHALILLMSIASGVLLSPVWFMVPLLTSLTPLYGGWLQFLCNYTQHIGMQDNVTDFRLSCRTFTVNPLVEYLYWHMNYHIEHHMYAAVPCYNLKQLHRAIEHDLPPCPRGLIATWKEIAAIQRLQSIDSNYQYVAPLPSEVRERFTPEAQAVTQWME